MWNKLKALFAVFRQGAAVANPKAWKQGQITATILGGFFMALVTAAKAFGYDIPLDNDTALAVAGGLVAGANWILTIVTSKHVGLPGLQPAGVELPSPLPSPQEGSGSPLPAPQAAPVSRVDVATRERAEAFLRARRPAGNPADPSFEAP
jgi:hypothetical protein